MSFELLFVQLWDQHCLWQREFWLQKSVMLLYLHWGRTILIYDHMILPHCSLLSEYFIWADTIWCSNIFYPCWSFVWRQDFLHDPIWYFPVFNKKIIYLFNVSFDSLFVCFARLSEDDSLFHLLLRVGEWVRCTTGAQVHNGCTRVHNGEQLCWSASPSSAWAQPC